MNYNELLDKAKDEKITDEEVESVAQILMNGDIKNKYTLLHIIGRSCRVKYENLAASYLFHQEDSMLVKLAIQILCFFWGKTEEYLSYVKKFLKRSDWDEDDDTRLISISIAGEYLREKRDNELLKELLELYNTDGDQLIRESAYSALARSYGKGWKEIPPASRHFNLKTDIDPKVIEWAEQQIKA